MYSRSFLALVATQFFVSLNDNMFRWLVVPIGKELMDNAWHDMPAVVQRWMRPEPLALSLGLASFTLPFLVFAAPAGFLADRFSKRHSGRGGGGNLVFVDGHSEFFAYDYVFNQHPPDSQGRIEKDNPDVFWNPNRVKYH